MTRRHDAFIADLRWTRLGRGLVVFLASQSACHATTNGENPGGSSGSGGEAGAASGGTGGGIGGGTGGAVGGSGGSAGAGGGGEGGAAGGAGAGGGGGSAGSAGAGGLAAAVLDVDYAPDDDPAHVNPERGIYYWSPAGDASQTVVAEWLYLGDWCDQDLVWAGHGAGTTSPVLDAYADELAAHRAAGRKVLFRPRYDTSATGGVLNACGVFQADTVVRMRAHVDAIAAMLAEFVDVVAFIEAGYLGRWGEWNHADHAATTAPVLVDPTERRAFITYVLNAYASAGVDRFVGLRRPVFARELVDVDPTAKVGLYNDCFMTTGSDYGTYSNFESGNPANFASSAEAKAWAMAFTATAPFGGETCPTGDNTERWRDCDNMVGPTSEPGQLHMSYLHGGYAQEARPLWEAGGCYDEIRRRLGYRFEIESVEYPPTAAAAQELGLTVIMRNTGWARLHNARRAYLVLRGASEAYVVGGPLDGYTELPGVVSGEEVSAWAPGENATLTAVLSAPPPGVYSLRLLLPDADRPDIVDYAITFASLRGGVPVGEGVLRENDLGVEVNVTP